jgi:drug/metabolite transporter (DMT)-like permease
MQVAPGIWPTSRISRPAVSSHASDRGDLITALSLPALAIIWGANFTIVKVALVELSPVAFNALRFPVASLLLYAILRARDGISLPARADVWRVVGLGVLGNVVYQNLFIYGLALTSAGNGSLLLATVPIWTVLLSVFLGHERPSALVWAGILATLAGMALVVAGGPSVRLGGSSLAGDLLMVGAAIGWSIYTVGSRNLIRRYGPLRVTSWTLWVGTVGLVLLGLPDVVRTPLTEVSTGSWLAVVYAGCLALTVAYLIWYRGVQRLGSARTAAYSNLVPVVAMIVAWIWLAERPSTLQLMGAGVILGGITLASLGKSKQR